MKGLCAIISGGEYSPMDDIKAAEYIIACDRGYSYAKRSGIVPDLLLGDFDSYTGKLPEGAAVERLPREKDDTDTMHAVRRALELGFTRISLYCALGGRLDHALANVFSLIGSGLDGMMADDREMLLVMRQNDEVSVRLDSAPLAISLIALSPICDGVTITGTHWPLHDAVLKAYEPYAVSNKLKKESDGTFTVALKNGILGLYICLNQ